MKVNYTPSVNLLLIIVVLIIFENSCTVKEIKPDPNLLLEDSLLVYLPFNGNLRNEVDGSMPTASIIKLVGNTFRKEQSDFNKFTLTASRQGNAEQALYFNGEDFLEYQLNYKLNENAVSSFKNLTIAAWIRASDFIDTWQSPFPYIDFCQIVGSAGLGDDLGLAGLYVYYETDPFFRINLGGSVNYTNYSVSAHYNASIPMEIFIHVCVTFEGTTAKIYINGKQEVNSAYNLHDTPEIVYRPKLRLGQGFKGALDEIRIYNRTLSAEEVRQLARI